jgi:peroxiredoxin
MMKSKLIVIVMLLALVAAGCPKNAPSTAPGAPPPSPGTPDAASGGAIPEISAPAPPPPSIPRVSAPPPAPAPVSSVSSPPGAPPSPSSSSTSSTPSGPKVESLAKSTVRKPAPDFTLKGLDGKEYKLSAFKGKVVVLCFWSIGCPHCLNTVPTLDKLAQTEKGKAVEVILVTSDSPAATVGTVKELKLKVPVLLDPGDKISDQYGVEYYPTTYIIGPDGAIEDKHVGEKDYSVPAVLDQINKLLKGIS